MDVSLLLDRRRGVLVTPPLSITEIDATLQIDSISPIFSKVPGVPKSFGRKSFSKNISKKIDKVDNLKAQALLDSIEYDF